MTALVIPTTTHKLATEVVVGDVLVLPNAENPHVIVAYAITHTWTLDNDDENVYLHAEAHIPTDPWHSLSTSIRLDADQTVTTIS